jgi:hypothetical protein
MRNIPRQPPGYLHWSLDRTHKRLGTAIEKKQELPNSMADHGLNTKRAFFHAIAQLPHPVKKNLPQIHVMLAAHNVEHDCNTRLFGTVKEAFQFGAGLKKPGPAHGIAIVEDCHAVVMSFYKHANGPVTLLTVDPGNRIKGSLDTFEKFPQLLESADANPGGKIAHSIGTYAGVSRDLTSCVTVSHGMVNTFRKDPEYLGDTHEWIRARAEGKKSTPSFQVIEERVMQKGAVLPLKTYQDIQSATQLAHILNIREGAATEIINKKGETLPGRLETLTGKPWVKADPDTGRYQSTGLATPSDKVLSAARRNHKLSGLGVRYLEKNPEGGAP